ncbi:GNAT family N-acetyltransferase [Aliikangiella sp. G2MR2-5]|uniref:GNAT family N-acetyltransferase n=1 Tax=Aliikangiella sp. G2MR2-5 TaxID=2788943 RepID=UPI0018A9485B|nr:GNAT family N-acetyltransferase [Aliikangiella sp. G2MR2-5]
MIRKAKVDDYGVMAEIHNRSISVLCRNHYSAEFISAWVSNPKIEKYRKREQSGCEFYVYVCDNRIAGFVSVNWQECLLEGLFVDPDFSGRGVASELVNFVFDMADKNANDHFYVESSLNAVGFYRKAGFVEYGKGYFNVAEAAETESILMKANIKHQNSRC